MTGEIITNNTSLTSNGSAGIEAQRAKRSFQFREDLAPGVVIEMELKRILHCTQSEFQQIDVIETCFGRTLITDGKTQSAQFDEFSYHESLVHPPLIHFAHNNGRAAKTVFIGGGGELATAREVLRHPDVEKVVMVDLDEKVIDVSVKYLPEWGGMPVKNDPRFELIIGDAHAYLMNCQETFDVIIMDISDPIEAGPGIMLYTKELYQHAKTLLSPKGVFVTQAGIADGVPAKFASDGTTDTTCFGPINITLKQVFPLVFPYTTCIPSYGSDWGFVMASMLPESEVATDGREWIAMDEDTLNGLLDKYVTGGEAALGMYDGTTHRRMFHLTKPIRKYLANDTRVMTRDNPVFMY